MDKNIENRKGKVMTVEGLIPMEEVTRLLQQKRRYWQLLQNHKVKQV
jgi:hypothetical protein